MRILYVITGLGQGGAERVVCDLADNMYKRGHEVNIAYLTGEILTYPSYKEVQLIKVGLNNLFSLPKSYLKLAKIIKEYQPDVVHTHMVHANILMRLVRVITPINLLISTAHSSNEGGVLRMIFYRATHHLADVTTNVSQKAVEAFEEKRAVPQNGMKNIYNGIDLHKFKYLPDARAKLYTELSFDKDCKLILAVGRFSEAKDYPNLLYAIKLLKQENIQNFKLVIVGDGELRTNIEAMIEEFELKNDVVLLGRRSDIPMIMSACDLFVLSSHYEGLPTVLIEALACQSQVVSTDVSGAREILNDHGKIVPVKNPIALANALKTALVFDNHQNVLGYRYVKTKFDLDTISDEWLKIYNEQ